MSRNLAYLSIRAYGVHLLTASGVLFAFLAAMQIAATQPEPARVFLWLAIAGVIDAVDGPLARRWQTDRYATRISGAGLDDIIDFVTFTFLPLLLIWRMGWVPQPALLWIAPALIASLFGFTHTAAKQGDAGFFLGFPSYWNVVAFYAGLFAVYFGPEPVGWIMLLLAAMTVLPVRFIYPNRAPSPWRKPVILGAIAWFGLLLLMLPFYPNVPHWLMWLSLAYPVFYGLLSVYLDVRDRLAG